MPLPKDKLPITLGVIGHLDAVVTEGHIQLLTDLLDSIQRRYPSSPVVLFSQLAEGVDLQVAELFWQIKEVTRRDYHLVVPLPLPLEVYTGRFSAGEAQCFEELLSNSSSYFTIPNDSPHDADHYRSGGQFVADSSIILIALWDEVENSKKGGTADIVRYKREGVFSDVMFGSLFEKKGSVLSIPCRRSGPARKHGAVDAAGTTEAGKATDAQKLIDAARAADAGNPIQLLPADTLLDTLLSNKSISKALEKIEHMNSTSRKVPESKRAASAEQLFSRSDLLSPSQLLMRSYFSQTDTLAIYNRKAYVRVLNTLFFLGILIIGFFEWYKHLNHGRGFLLLVLGIIIGTIGFNILTLRWKNHLRFLENRILSESIRTQFYWNLSGVGKNVASFILRIHRAEFDWIKHILFAVNGICFAEEASGIDACFINEGWIVDQFSFFKRKVKSIHKLRTRLNMLSRAALVLATLVLTGILIAGDDIEQYESIRLLDDLIVLIGVLLGMFALSKAYVEKRAFHQLTNQYALMRDLFGAALVRIRNLEEGGDASNIELRKELIREVYFVAGREALIEIGNWHQIFKDKEPELEGIGG